MAKRKAALGSPSTCTQLKRLRTTPARAKALEEALENLKYSPTRQCSFFDHLNLDVRNLIYDYIKPTFRPLTNGHDWAGLYLSCRQARDELEAAAEASLKSWSRAFLNRHRGEAVISNEERGAIESVHTEGTRAITLKATTASPQILLHLLELLQLPCSEINIEFHTPKSIAANENTYTTVEFEKKIYEVLTDFVTDLDSERTFPKELGMHPALQCIRQKLGQLPPDPLENLSKDQVLNSFGLSSENPNAGTRSFNNPTKTISISYNLTSSPPLPGTCRACMTHMHQVSPHEAYRHLKRLRTTPARNESMQALEKYWPKRQCSFFDHLNLDVRNLIYDYMKPTLRPFEDGRNRAGLYLACRQAKEELDDVASTAFRTWAKDRGIKKGGVTIEHNAEFRTITIKGNLASMENLHDIYHSLRTLRFKALKFNFKGQSSAEESEVKSNRMSDIATSFFRNAATAFDTDAVESMRLGSHTPTTTKTIVLEYTLNSSLPPPKICAAKTHLFTKMSPYYKTLSGPKLAYGATESEDGNYALRILTVPSWYQCQGYHRSTVQWVVNPSISDKRARRVDVTEGIAVAPGEEALGKLLNGSTC